MPYNPEDPNSDPHNPEGAAIVSPGAEGTTEELVRVMHPHAIVRNQEATVLATVEKISAVWYDLRDGKISQADANSKLDQLVETDVAIHVVDEFALDHINNAIASIRNPNPPIN
jgi:hypothetical protein